MIDDYGEIERYEEEHPIEEEGIIDLEQIDDGPVKEEESVKEEPVAEDITVETVVPIQTEAPAENEERIPIYAVNGLTDSEKRLVLETRIADIINKTQIPYIPARVKFKDSFNSPYKYALLRGIDHRYVQEAWDFYEANASSPTATEFFDIIRKHTRNPEEIFTRMVDVDLT